MASEKAVNQLVQAILDKRRKLGLVDRGIIPIEDVINKLNQQDQSKKERKHKESLAEDTQDHHNNTR